MRTCLISALYGVVLTGLMAFGWHVALSLPTSADAAAVGAVLTIAPVPPYTITVQPGNALS